MALASLLPCQPHDVCVSKLEVQKLAQDASQFTISAYLIIVNLLSSFSKITFLKNVANF